MKVILQDSKTAKFMRCDSMWTLDINEALDFLSAQRAVSFGVKELKNSFQVVRVESNELPGTVIMAISNLRWRNGSQSALRISVQAISKSMADHGPLQRGLSPSSSILILDDAANNRRSNDQPSAVSGFPDDEAKVAQPAGTVLGGDFLAASQNRPELTDVERIKQRRSARLVSGYAPWRNSTPSAQADSAKTTRTKTSNRFGAAAACLTAGAG